MGEVLVTPTGEVIVVSHWTGQSRSTTSRWSILFLETELNELISSLRQRPVSKGQTVYAGHAHVLIGQRFPQILKLGPRAQHFRQLLSATRSSLEQLHIS